MQNIVAKNNLHSRFTLAPLSFEKNKPHDWLKIVNSETYITQLFDYSTLNQIFVIVIKWLAHIVLAQLLSLNQDNLIQIK